MFTSIRDLLNRVNGDKPKANDPNAVQVTVKETTVVIPKEALENLIRTTVREVVSQVLPVLMQQQRRSPFDSPYESPFSRRRSPFSSPFGDDNDDEGIDLGDIIAMAMAARARDERSENAPFDGMPAGLAEALRSMRERMSSQDEEEEDDGPVLTPAEVVAAYQAGDFSNKLAELAFAVLATWDNNRDAIMAPELGLNACMAAHGLIKEYKDGERVCSNCDGDDGCPVQLAFDTLVEYERMKDEEAAWAMHEAETQPAMAGVDADEGKNEAEQPSEPEFPHGVQQW